MTYITLFTCPNRSFSGLDFPPAHPLDLDGPYAAITAPGFTDNDSTDPGHPLGFGASLESMVHRNWKPCSWEMTGGATTFFTVNGAADRLGPVTGDTKFQDKQADIFLGVNFPVGEFFPVRPQKDFSFPENVRTMISWLGGGDGQYPTSLISYMESLYPVLVSPNGDQTVACLLGAKFQPYGTLEPYYWLRDGVYYCQHEFRIDVSFSFYFSPGDEVPSDWFLDEGQDVNWYGSSMSSLNTNFDRVFAGTCSIRDITGVDPEPDWGSVDMFANGGAQGATCNLVARVGSNFAKFPLYD